MMRSMRSMRPVRRPGNLTLRTKADRIVVLIRRELRVHDHLALWSAMQDSRSVIPLYIVGGVFHSISPAGQLVVLRSLEVMREELRRLGGELFIRRGEPHAVLLDLVRETGAAGVYLTESHEPELARTDARLKAALESEGKLFRAFTDDVVFGKSDVLNSSGEPFRVYTAYRRAWLAKKDSIAPPLPMIREIGTPPVEPGRIPDPRELGLPSGIRIPEAGELSGMAMLDGFLAGRAGAYRASRDMMAEPGTSRLSHHLATGTLSARRVYGAVARMIDDRAAEHRGSKASGGKRPPAGAGRPDGETGGIGPGEREGLDAFLGQIIWREFYKQILANFPHVAGNSFKREFDAVPWKTDARLFNAWRDGLTGYPVVDAAMRQLRQEGWMHNRGRMIAASFLAKDLHVDWRMGERYFMEWLADGDVALNNGGWQWSAGTGTDAQPWFRIFNPVLQGRKFDPDGSYVKRYLPELSAVPARYVHAPWNMSESAAAAAGVRIGRDYPAPIVDHDTERRNALERYRPRKSR